MATAPKTLPAIPSTRRLKRVAGEPSARVQKSASVAEAKAGFSALVRTVELNREEIVLLRRGVPVAKIVPIAEMGPQSGYGWMRGSVQELGDIVGPTGEEWTVGDD